MPLRFHIAFFLAAPALLWNSFVSFFTRTAFDVLWRERGTLSAYERLYEFSTKLDHLESLMMRLDAYLCTLPRNDDNSRPVDARTIAMLGVLADAIRRARRLNGELTIERNDSEASKGI